MPAVKHLGEKVEKPEDSEKYLQNVIDLVMLGTVNIASSLNKACRQQTNAYSEKVRKKRDIVSKLIDCIKFCGEFDQRGKDESSHSPKTCVFRGSLESLKTSFLNSTTFRGTSKIIQNELLDCPLDICHDEICTEIKQTKFLS